MLELIWYDKQLVFRSIVLRVLLNPSRVDDILQEAFAHVLASGKTFPTEEDAYRYIRRVVFNTTIDHYRASTPVVDCFLTETIFVYSEPRSSQPNPLTALLKDEFTTSKSELLEEVARALTDLPADQREAIHLILGPRPRKLKEMCREIGVPYSTLGSRMMAGLERIRRKAKGQRALSTLPRSQADWVTPPRQLAGSRWDGGPSRIHLESWSQEQQLIVPHFHNPRKSETFGQRGYGGLLEGFEDDLGLRLQTSEPPYPIEQFLVSFEDIGRVQEDEVQGR